MQKILKKSFFMILLIISIVFLPNNVNALSTMSNLSEIKSGYTANDVVYYKLDVEINKKGTININGQEINVARRRRKDFEIAFQRYDLEFRGE